MLRRAFTITFSFISLTLSAQLTFTTDPNATGETAQVVAGALNDSWETAQQVANCGTDPFLAIYGILMDDCSGGAPVGAGSISGLVQTDNLAYAGIVTFEERLIAEDDSDLGTKGISYTNACGATGGVRDDANNTMQGNAPSADGVGMIDSDGDGNLDYYNSYASPQNGKKSAILFSFSQPVTHFGMFLGDFESRSDGVDGYPGMVVIFNGASIIAQADIPTGTANQSNCDGDSNASFDGCGNDETVWVEYTGAALTDILIVVGEVSSDSSPNNNKGSFSGITLGGRCDVALPVELAAFSVEPSGGNALVKWTTELERNNAFFVVEHSADGTHFQEVGIVEGEGEALQGFSYSWEHQQPVSGQNYYRLRQVDLDGTFAFSPIRNLFFADNAEILLAPNPTQDVLYLHHLSATADLVTIQIVNSFQQFVMTKTIYYGEAVDVSSLSNGIYFIYINKDYQQAYRFVKQ